MEGDIPKLTYCVTPAPTTASQLHTPTLFVHVESVR